MHSGPAAAETASYGYEVIHPPNSPASHVCQMYSDHPGGANVANGDGSVRFVSEFVNQDVWRYVSSMAAGEVICIRSVVMTTRAVPHLWLIVATLMLVFLVGCRKPYPQLPREQLKLIQGIRTAANTRSKQRVDAVKQVIKNAIKDGGDSS